MIRQALLMQFAFNGRAAGMNFEGVTHEESLARPPVGGNPLNWVLGHIVDCRTSALGLLGERPVWNEREHALYGVGSDSSAAGWRALPLDELLVRHRESQECLVRALEAAPAAVLEKEVPKLFEPQEK